MHKDFLLPFLLSPWFVEFCFQEENVEMRKEWKCKFHIKSGFGPFFLICWTACLSQWIKIPTSHHCPVRHLCASYWISMPGDKSVTMLPPLWKYPSIYKAVNKIRICPTAPTLPGIYFYLISIAYSFFHRTIQKFYFGIETFQVWMGGFLSEKNPFGCIPVTQN